ncbi:MAG: hypothetical protein IK102_02735 [Treponema sp.]|nr:hypothetical protein [Treponema sp.]
MRYKKFLLFFVCVLFISCNKKIEIYGQWENEDRKLVFDLNDIFVIEYKHPNQIQAFRGTYTQKKNIVVLIFEEYKTSDNVWISTYNTTLAEHKEVLNITITENNLTTKIVSTGKEYSYLKIP